MASLVLSRLVGRVAVITLNAPSRLNALTVAMGDEFSAALSALSFDKVGAVVLTGAGAAFSAGGDLAFLRARATTPPHVNVPEMIRFYKRFLGPLRSCPVPVVAAVHGAAVGAGACVATACDVRVVARTARVGFTFTSGVAIHPGMGATHYLPRVVGPGAAARLLLTGEIISGTEAAALQWASGSAEEDASAVLPRALELAGAMAAAAPVAMRSTLATLRSAGDVGLDAALHREASAQAVCYAGPDFLLGLDAVASKSKTAPQWTQWHA